MQSIEWGLFAPESLLSVCLPFLAKVHPRAQRPKNRHQFLGSKVDSLLTKRLQSIRQCHFYPVEVISLDVKCYYCNIITVTATVDFSLKRKMLIYNHTDM